MVIAVRLVTSGGEQTFLKSISVPLPVMSLSVGCAWKHVTRNMCLDLSVGLDARIHLNPGSKYADPIGKRFFNLSSVSHQIT